MPQKRHRLEEIVARLRQADVLFGEGKKIPEVIKTPGHPRGHLLPLAQRVRRAQGLSGETAQGPGARECTAMVQTAVKVVERQEASPAIDGGSIAWTWKDAQNAWIEIVHPTLGD